MYPVSILTALAAFILVLCAAQGVRMVSYDAARSLSMEENVASQEKGSLVIKLVDRAGLRFSRLLSGAYGPRRRARLESRLKRAGYPAGLTQRKFIQRETGFVVLGIIVLLFCFLIDELIIGVGLGLLLAFWMQVWLTNTGLRRSQQIDRDLPDAGYAVRRPEALRRWLAAYAAASSTTTAYSKLLNTTTAGDGSQPTRDTTLAYRDHLTQLWLLDPVPGWSPSGNPFTRLQQAPKHQLVDPALAATLLRATAASMMTPRSSHLAGPLFESLATLTVRVAAEAIRAHVGHLRTRNGDHEIDLVVEGRDGRIVACEVKLAAAVADSDVRHLLWLREQLPDDVSDLVVITTGTHAYRRGDGVAVVPLALLGP